MSSENKKIITPNKKIITLNKIIELPECFVNDDFPLIDPGIYDLGYVYHTTENMFGNPKAPKLTLWFQVLDYGDFFQKKLPRYYNVINHVGKIGKNGNFKVGKKSDFLREYFNMFPLNNPKRLDRIAMSPFKDTIIRGRVETVTKDYRQRGRHKLLHYSVIRELLEPKNI